LKKNLVLTGMMGVGKSTIGKSLSKKLNMKFFDTDSMIENEEKMTIKNIFEKKGEEHFREIEKKTILKTLNNANAVIALGGGAFINTDIRNEILKSCVSFWLFMNIKNLLKRLSDTNKRPLLDAKNLEDSLKILYEKRKKIYETANFKVDCNVREKSEIANEIIKLYEKN
tara:strand:+ start:4533 stop:5042 length:510 start_codon:yes stop_codon:yes gene_type:complete